MRRVVQLVLPFAWKRHKLFSTFAAFDTSEGSLINSQSRQQIQTVPVSKGTEHLLNEIHVLQPLSKLENKQTSSQKRNKSFGEKFHLFC